MASSCAQDKIERGELDVYPVGAVMQKHEVVRTRPSRQPRGIARAVAVNDGDEGDDRRRADQRGDDPLFQPIEDAVEH